jgi:topoisomerase-4 subunit A
MTQLNTTNSNNDDSISALSLLDSSYLNYSMYVIMDRSLPHIGDGLKPVQRRLLFSMNELKLTPQSKYKKSARTVGDTLGKFHPHGDTACYEAMVNLAQPFNTRVPLVDGQGNWGSMDEPKSFAAMRYTESKLTHYAQTMLDELKQDTVNWLDNFDGTLKQPEVLPAQLPNLLLNGVTGIAVGMATDIPPFAADEVINAVCQTLTKKRTSDEDILNCFSAPDYPSGGTVIDSLENLHEVYRTGRGGITLRAKYVIDEKNSTITFLSGSYRGDFNKVIQKISEQIKEHKLPVSNMTDLADKKVPIRLQLKISGKNKIDFVLRHLLNATDLEKRERVILNCIGIDGKPYIRSLPTLVREWSEFRTKTFIRKKEFRLRAVDARIHIIDGFLIAFDNIDEIIRIIREKDHPKPEIMKMFGLSDIQATSILALRLSQLSRLESNTLIDERKALVGERDEIRALLADESKIRRAVVSEIKNHSKPFISERKCTWEEATPTSPIAAEEMIDASPATVILSQQGWIRAMKGHDVNYDTLKFMPNDKLLCTAKTQYNVPTIMLGDKGRCYSVMPHQLPNGKGVGEAVTTKITLLNGEKISNLLPFDESAKLLLSTGKGFGFITPVSEMNTKMKKGKVVVSLTDGDTILPPISLKGDEEEVAILTKAGRLIVIPIDSINEYEKAKGMQLVGIKKDEFAEGNDAMTDITALPKKDDLVLLLGKRKLILTDAKREIYRAERARRGNFLEGKRPRSTLKFER